MKNKLEQLESKLKEVNHPVINYLQHGLSETEVGKFFYKLRLLPPQALLDFYEWHNGVSDFNEHPSGKVDLLPLGIFFPFDIAFQQYEQNKSKWGVHLWPLLGSGDADCYLINLTHDMKNNGKIYFASVPLRQKPYLKHSSISKMIETIYEYYNQGAYFIDSDNYVEIRNELEDSIYKELNPGID